MSEKSLPPEERNSRSESRKLEWIVAIGLGVLSVSVFILQAVTTDSKTTPLETALFNCIQFLLTVGFAWFSTRAVSRYEFEQSLKRFAVSAYRRISDIEKMISRLDVEVDGMLGSAGPRESEYLRIVRAIVADTGQVVRSSSADWADVIGEELLALERIKTLERERSRLTVDQQTAIPRVGLEDRLSEINVQIRSLQASLPARLTLDSDEHGEVEYREKITADWLAREHRRSNGLVLTCVTGSGYRSTRDRTSVERGEILLGMKNGEGALDAVDRDGKVVGRIQNDAPMRYDEFVSGVERCYTLPLRLRFIEDLGASGYEDDEITGWFRVQVTSSPSPEESE